MALGATTAMVVASAAPVGGQEDRAAKPGVIRSLEDRWLLKDDLGPGPADHSFVYGSDDAIHVIGDWDGDGERTPGVIRPAEDPSRVESTPLVWHLRNSNDRGPADIVVRFGEATSRETFDTPVVGDWNGDGVETVGVVRIEREQDRFRWMLRNENRDGEPDITFHYGSPGGFGMLSPDDPRDVPVVGDWDGDGVTTPGVVHEDPSTGRAEWRLRNANTGGAAQVSFHYGNAGDRPLVGDWDGDGTETAGVLRGFTRWLLIDHHRGGAAERDFHYGADERDQPIVWR